MQGDKLKEFTLNLISLCKEQKNLVITGHDMPDHDSVISSVMMQRFLGHFGVRAEIKFGTRWDSVTERDMNALGLGNGISFDGFDENDSLLLVDHHKTFYENRVIACVDHHTTPPEPDFDLFLIHGASSCGRIIYDMAVSVGLDSSEYELLALYSVFFDTQGCRSIKYRMSDTPWVDECIKKYSLDRAELEDMGCCFNSVEESIDTLAMSGFKKYEFDGKRSISTCVQMDTSRPEWEEKIEDIIEFLQSKIREESYFICAFVVNMPKEARSDIYFIEGDGVECLRLPRLASRSRDVIPAIAQRSRA